MIWIGVEQQILTSEYTYTQLYIPLYIQLSSAFDHMEQSINDHEVEKYSERPYIYSKVVKFTCTIHGLHLWGIIQQDASNLTSFLRLHTWLTHRTLAQSNLPEQDLPSSHNF